MQYSILSPYLVPESISYRKKINVGDGFILRRIERALEPATPAFRFSTWVPLTPADIEKINSTKALFIAGANQLQDTYALAPEMTWELYQSIKVPIIPFGVGVWGHPSRNSGPRDLTRRIISDLHDRISFSSWRCPQTVRYLNEHFPELKSKTLMTSCPVVFDAPLIKTDTWHSTKGPVAVTITERENFWDREKAIIDFVHSRFPDQPRRVVLHQKFDKHTPRLLDKLLGRRRSPADLHRYASEKGFEIVTPATVEECWAGYEDTALHVGSRLHAHLYFLSQAKKSLLVSVDDRGRGFAESLGFPNAPSSRLAAWDSVDYDAIRANARKYSQTMGQFLAACRTVLS